MLAISCSLITTVPRSIVFKLTGVYCRRLTSQERSLSEECFPEPSVNVYTFMLEYQGIAVAYPEGFLSDWNPF